MNSIIRKGDIWMSKKVIAGFAVFFVGLSIWAINVFAMSTAPSVRNQEITAEAFAPGTYKTYKNDDLSYSFKYPKGWYLTETPKGWRGGALEFELTNYNPHKEPKIAFEERAEISGFIVRDSYNTPPKDTKEIINRIIKNYQDANKYNSTEGYNIREINKVEIKNGIVFFVKGTEYHYKAEETKYEVWLLYFHLNDGSTYFRDLTKMTPANIIVQIFPGRSNKDIFMKIIKSIVIY